MRSRVIGGEFDLRAVPEPMQRQRPSGYYCYASGRAALYQILMSIKLAAFKVWLPDWLCESMIDAVKRTGLDYGFYELGADLQMDVRRFVEKNRSVSENDVIVLVNYFGLTDVERTIEELRSLKVESVIVEDDVQALFSFLDNKATHLANYRFTSLRKTIAAPDGGLVYTKKQMPSAQYKNTFAAYKLKGALVKGAADETTDDNEYLSLFEQGEDLIENNYESEMSGEASAILAGTNFEEVAKKRRENARYLTAKLEGLGIEPLLKCKGNQVPLFAPILIDNRDEVRRELRRNGIFCPVHWPLRKDMEVLPMGLRMAEKELSLVIDQRYNQVDMDSIVQVLKNTLWK